MVCKAPRPTHPKKFKSPNIFFQVKNIFLGSEVRYCTPTRTIRESIPHHVYRLLGIEKGPWNCSEGTIWGYHTVAMLGVKEKFFLIQKNTIEKGPWNCSEGTIWRLHTVAMLGVKENTFFLIQKNSFEKGTWNCSEGTIWWYQTVAVAMLGVKNKFFLIQKKHYWEGTLEL